MSSQLQANSIRKIASATSLSSNISDSDPELSSPDAKSEERSVSSHVRSTRANTEDLDTPDIECLAISSSTEQNSVSKYRRLADESMKILKENVLEPDDAWVLKRRGPNFEIFIRASASADKPVTMKAVRQFKCSAKKLFKVLSTPEKWDKQIDQRERLAQCDESLEVFYTATKAVTCLGVTLIDSREIVTLRACYELDEGRLLIEAGRSLEFDISKLKTNGRNRTRAQVLPGSGAVIQAIDENTCVLSYVVCTDLGGSLSSSNKNLGYIISEVAPGQLVTFLNQVQVGVDGLK